MLLALYMHNMIVTYMLGTCNMSDLMTCTLQWQHASCMHAIHVIVVTCMSKVHECDMHVRYKIPQ